MIDRPMKRKRSLVFDGVVINKRGAATQGELGKGDDDTSTYHPSANEVQEVDVLLAGEDVFQDGDDDIPIRKLDRFTIFDAQTSRRVSLMSILTEDACESWVGVGDVSPFYDDDEEDNDDDARAENVRLSTIIECSVHWVEDASNELDEWIYVRTRFAWYALLQPAAEYSRLYNDTWINHRLTHAILVCALENHQVTRASVLAWVQEHPGEFPALIARLSAADLSSSIFVSYFTAVMDRLCEDRDEFCRQVAQCALVIDLHPTLLAQLSIPSKSRRRRKAKYVKSKILERLNPTVVTPRVAAIAHAMLRRPLKVADMAEESETVLSPVFHPDHPDNPVSAEWVEATESPGVYRSVDIDGVIYSAGDVVMVEPGSDDNKAREMNAQSEPAQCINTLANTKWFCQVCYFFQDEKGSKRFHAQWLQHGSKTLLQNTAHSKGLFWLKECADLSLECIYSFCDLHSLPVGELEPNDEDIEGNHFFAGLTFDGANQAFVELSSEERKLALSHCETSRPCLACGLQVMQEMSQEFNLSGDCATYQGVDYHVNDFVYVQPKQGRLLDVAQIKGFAYNDGCIWLQVCKYGHYDHVVLQHSKGQPICQDNRRLFMTEVTTSVDIRFIMGKAFVACPVSPWDKEAWVQQDDHFYCDLYAQTLLPSLEGLHHLNPSTLVQCVQCCSIALDALMEEQALLNTSQKLRGLELFAGAGGLGTGMAMSGIEPKWAVEFKPAAAKTYMTNHANTVVYNQCSNLLLEHCIATTEGKNPAPLWSLDGSELLPPMPLRGEVDFIFGGPPCQGFSHMNHQPNPDDVRNTLVCNMISYVDFYRPMYFLLENVPGLLEKPTNWKYVKFIFRALIALGYQVHVRCLQTAQYGAPQGRRRVIFLGARRDVPLPEFPLPQYASELDRICQQKIKLPSSEIIYPLFRPGDKKENQCAPLTAITIDAAIGDLPKFNWILGKGKQLSNQHGSLAEPSILQVDATSKPAGFVEPVHYPHPPLSRYQNWMRCNNGDTVSCHHNAKHSAHMVERVINVPIRAHANHADLPKHLRIPRLLNSQGKSTSEGKSVYGRLDGDGHFATAMTKVNPGTKGGKVLHPNQARVLTVREFARAQGFPDNYVFLSMTEDAHGRVADQTMQIGNAVPVPLALALGKEVRKAYVKLLRQRRDRHERGRQQSPELA